MSGKMDTMDLIIEALEKHEKRLDEAAERLETLGLKAIGSRKIKDSKKKEKTPGVALIKKILRAAGIIQAFNGSMDLALWILIGYMVPCWTIAAMSLASTALFLVLESRL